MTIALLDIERYPFTSVIRMLRTALIDAQIVDVGEWQAKVGDAPQTLTAEVEDVSFTINIPQTRELLQALIRPNLPWAEEHFAERIGGEPVNPPPSHIRWPFAVANNASHRVAEQFSHSYPERLWPKQANGHRYLQGVRFPVGDLNDVVTLLRERRATRQAYIPIWFPEDSYAARYNNRVPCTLGYHVMIRRDRLKIVYYIRACDFYRHFRDDVYLAARLVQWLCSQLDGVTPDRLVMHISSLHVFKADVALLRSAEALDNR